MIKTVDLIKNLDEKYHKMVAQVNIPDFYKCIAQFSGLNISEVNDNVIKRYLVTWCKNKYRFFQMLGNKIKLDQKFVYKRPETDLSESFLDLGKQFPAFYQWLYLFKSQTRNKIERLSDYGIEGHLKNDIRLLFPQFSIEGSSITHFFKSRLNAPDELVTKIGGLFENDKIEAFHTISIDPVDMMLASENPYDWNSCYRLELDRSDSHADGCLAAVLDTTSLITYVWSNEGKYDLYGNYKFKNIRYYRMRGWIAISDNFAAIHFNSVYPGRSNYDEEFNKQLRDVVETVVAKYKGVANKWRKNPYIEIDKENDSNYYYRDHRYIYECSREYGYGYGEYDENYIFVNSEVLGELGDKIKYADFEKIHKRFNVYDERIECPCGCGSDLTGSDEYDDEDMEYNGGGFIAENFYEQERYWCDYKDDYCDTECCSGNCEGCSYWDDNHPICDLDDCECDDPDWDNLSGDVMQSNEEHCCNCPRWKECHPEEEEKEEEITDSAPDATTAKGVTLEELSKSLSELANAASKIAIDDQIVNVDMGVNPDMYATTYLGKWNIPNEKCGKLD